MAPERTVSRGRVWRAASGRLPPGLQPGLTGVLRVERSEPDLTPPAPSCCSGAPPPPGEQMTCRIGAGMLSLATTFGGASKFNLSPDATLASPSAPEHCLVLSYAVPWPQNPDPGAKLALHFSNAQEKERWLAALTAERDASHLALDPALSDFLTSVRDQLWCLFFSGAHDELRALYFADWRGGTNLVGVLLGAYRAALAFQPPNANDAIAFAKLLAAVCVDTPLRVALLRLQLQEDALRCFAKKGVATSDDFTAFVEATKVRLKSMGAGDSSLFLRHHGHPAEKAAVTMCADEELSWFTSLYADNALLSLDEFVKMTGPGCALQLARTYAQRDNADALLTLLRSMPAAELKANIADYSQLLFDVPHAIQAAVMTEYASKGLVDARFLESMLVDGLTDARVVALCSFVSASLVGAQGCTFTPLAVKQLTNTLPRYPVMLVEAIYSVTCTDAGIDRIDPRHDKLRRLLELALLFEQDVRDPGWRNVQTLSRWLCAGPEQKERCDKMRSVLRATRFLDDFTPRIFDESKAALWPEDGYAAPPVGLAPASSVRLSQSSFVRSKEALSLLLFGLLNVCLQFDTALINEVLSKMRGWETSVLGKTEPLRGKVVDAIVRVPAYRDIYAGDGGGFLAMMRSGTLLMHPMHFTDSVLRALCLPKQIASGNEIADVCKLLTLALKLKQWAGLDATLRDIWARNCTADDRKRQMQHIVGRAVLRSDADFFASPEAAEAIITLSDVDDCVRYATEAMRMLPLADTQLKLQRVFDFYLKNSPPASWCGLFRGAETIAFFLKYLDREDLGKAYAAYDKENVGNELYNKLAPSVKSGYATPVITSDDVQLTDANAINTLIERLSGTDGSNLPGLLQQLAGQWMRRTYARLQTPMAPRNAQIITFMLCASWAQSRLQDATGGGMPKSLVARVGTGEGKSLIIAMVATFCAKLLKKKVHVLESNMGLLSRDYESFRDFYASFGLTSSSNNFSQRADITYCLKEYLDNYYRENVGRQPFADTILIVDEVDSLIVDDDPNQSYVKADADANRTAAPMFEAFKCGDASAFTSNDLYNETRLAVAEAERMMRVGLDQPGGYVIRGNKCMRMDAGGKVKESSYELALEYVSYIKCNRAPQVMSRFFYQSTPHMLRQYNAILGLSGSLGSDAELAFLKSMYDAKTLTCPPFLDTCRGVRKEPPSLLSGQIFVYPDARSHADAVISAALARRAQVPIIVLCTAPKDARSMFEAFPAAERASGAVQLMLEVDNKGERTNCSALVEKATAAHGDGKKTKTWRITVSDLFGGRGQDYRTTDADVDNAGGLLVIATGFPVSEREWVQWLGRTARNDRKGQYGVLLQRSEPPIKDDAALLDKYRAGDGARAEAYTSALVDELLRMLDKECMTKLESRSHDCQVGIRMNELCDALWTRAGGVTDAWPSTAEQRQLRAFLTDHSNVAFDRIEAFAGKLGLTLPKAGKN